jgi:hypothetical protein
MATPTVTGLSALLLQDYRSRFPGRPDPSNATLKTLLAHNAEDLGPAGPDYQTGYGLVKIQPTIDFMRTGSFYERELVHGDSQSVSICVSSGTERVEATLAWDDVPGTPNVEPALVNDLDVRVIDPRGRVHYPWTLDPEAPAAPATHDRPDRLNNIEQVVVDDPAPGIWRIEVTGHNVPVGPQTYSLCISPLFESDCDGDGTIDAQQIQNDPSLDCGGDGILDVCEPDCNGNGRADSCDILAGSSIDCGGDGIPDECNDAVDCNLNDIDDSCDIAEGTSEDCNDDLVPDECETITDCNGNSVADVCDVLSGESSDCNRNARPDECDIASGASVDCQGDGVPDECLTPNEDCNVNDVPDECDIASGISRDGDGDGVPDECRAEVLYVVATATGADDGTSWRDAFSSLQSPLAIGSRAGNAVREIWVAAGTYLPTSAGGSREVTFTVPSGVALYGGFAGDEQERDERDPWQHVTILSGDLNGDDGPDFANMEENAYRVVTILDADESTILDGFVVTGGRTTDDACRVFTGGGIHIEGGAPEIRQCVITGNMAAVGGGVHVEAGDPTLEDCVITGNKATEYGGGFVTANLSSLVGGLATLSNGSPFTAGGPLFDDGGDPVLIDCLIGENQSVNGGGLWIAGGRPTFRNCLIERNTAKVGGGMTNWGAAARIVGCTFVENFAQTDGGALLNMFEADPVIESTLFVGNASETGGAIQIGDLLGGASRPLLVNCAFSDNRASDAGGAL